MYIGGVYLCLSVKCVYVYDVCVFTVAMLYYDSDAVYIGDVFVC